ncbi:MAG TPA: sugar phosphate isomerase/epimerase [Isosphaeraceae bacterium]|jgi:sugar phosphate isomerase/epimerase|nr:sugar phosphate isomerase/epimerase [Isosphaeraceae bacterium]
MELSRREWLTTVPVALGAGLTGAALNPVSAAEPTTSPDEPFGYCLNTSTIQGQKLALVDVVETAAKAGYQGIEPWIRELDQHVKDGHSLKDLGKRIRDLGLSVESAIGFFDWIVDDEARRKKAFEEARRNMEMVRQIGGKRLAAPPMGATDRGGLDPRRVAERYRSLLELGEQFNVVPEVEVWGSSKSLGRLGEAVQVAVDCGHRSACVLPDVFHLYKGGSSFAGVKLLGPFAIGVFHFNDYPATPPRETITDAQRVYPGDGVAPLSDLLRDLRAIGYRGMLSLELFNRDYWKQDALAVARTGLEKMRAVVKSSLA